MRSKLAAGAVVIALASMLASTPANGAPVSLSAAILTASEFPADSAGYSVATSRPSDYEGIGVEANSPACLAAYQQHAVAIRGATLVRASAKYAGSTISTSILSRPSTSSSAALSTGCGSLRAVTMKIDTPPDVEQFNAAAFRSVESDGTVVSYTATADIRGTTVSAAITANPGPANEKTFWTLFRAQVAKVVRQP